MLFSHFALSYTLEDVSIDNEYEFSNEISDFAYCESPRFQVVLSSCTTTSSHQKLEVGRTTGKSWFSKVNSDRLMQFLFVSSLSLSSWTFLILCFMQNTAFDQTNAIFPTQFYKLVLGVIANIESWENDFEYEYGLKSFSYSYSLLMLTSSIVLDLSTEVTNLPNKTTIFHDFQGPTIKFHDFPGLENAILRFHDSVPGFPWPVRTLMQSHSSTAKSSKWKKALLPRWD